MAKLKVAALQLPTVGMSLNRLEYFIKAAAGDGVKLLLLGEYVLNHFFKEIESMPKSMVVEQSAKHLQTLREISNRYAVMIVAPLVTIENENYFKKIVVIDGDRVQEYQQDRLIDYEHWDEKAFFSNTKHTELPVFEYGGIKIAIVWGFELHFNEKFDAVMDSACDLVLLPTCSTFDSHNRWREIIKSRAFMHNCYILRANRVGEYFDGANRWRFYGDSMLALPNGEVGDMLDDRESLLVATVDSEYAKAQRDAWGFYR
ncbi:MAG: carbon-nitrogen hydrolase family protein [Campylobacterota bacterium]